MLTMTKTTENRVPELRFPEFDMDWEKSSLGSVAHFSKGKNISKQDISDDGEIECIRYGELYTTYSELIKDVVSKTNLQKKYLVLSKVNDVIIPASGETQEDIAKASCVTKADVALGGDLNIIRSPLNGVFLSYYLNNKRKYDIARVAQGISVVHLYSNQLKTIKLNIPSLPEQQKIASFLSAVDGRIRQLARKKELLEQYKKGVMQKLFKREIRFKREDGSDFPEWEIKRLLNIASPIKRTSERAIQKIMTISGGNGFLNQEERFSQVIAGGSLSKYTHLLKDEFSYNRGNSKSYHYGCIYKMNEEEALVQYVYHSFKLRSGDPAFFEQLFISKHLDRQLRRLISSSARMDGLLNISQSGFFSVKVIFPCLEEQNKIADFLTSIDKKTEQVSLQLEKTRAFKKGLLQQMFV